MTRLLRYLFIALGVSALLIGCAKQEDRLIRAQIDYFNSAAAEFEKVKDKDSMARAQTAVEALTKQHQKATEDFAALDESAKEAAMSRNRGAYQTAFERLRVAKAQANDKIQFP